MVTDDEALWHLLPQWWALWTRSETSTPFTSPAWLSAWWRNLGGGPLRVFSVWSAGHLVGMLPMFIYHDEGVRRLLPLGIGVSDTFDILAEPDWTGSVAQALGPALASSDGGWDRCELHEVPEGSPLLNLEARVSFQSVSPVLDLAGFASMPARSSPRRRLVRARHAAREAGLVLDQASPEAMDHLFRLHTAQWCARGETGVLGTAALQAFHREVSAGLHAVGALRLHRARHDGRTVAVLYGFAVRHRTYTYLSGVDPAYVRLGLGTALIGQAIEAAIVQGGCELDFLRGAEPYKYAWGATDRRLMHLGIPAEQPLRDEARRISAATINGDSPAGRAMAGQHPDLAERARARGAPPLRRHGGGRLGA